MAWIEERRRTDGQVSVRVKWRLGGGRGAPFQIETFSVGSDAQNRDCAEGFKQMVDAAGQYWPEGWVKGEGFVRPRDDSRYEATPNFAVVGEEYVRQIVDLSPGQRKRYLSQIRTLVEVEVRGERIFERAIDAITEGDIKAWLIDWDRALKTKANCHGLLFGVFTYANDGSIVSRRGRISRVSMGGPGRSGQVEVLGPLVGGASGPAACWGLTVGWPEPGAR